MKKYIFLIVFIFAGLAVQAQAEKSASGRYVSIVTEGDMQKEIGLTVSVDLNNKYTAVYFSSLADGTDYNEFVLSDFSLTEGKVVTFTLDGKQYAGELFPDEKRMVLHSDEIWMELDKQEY